MTVTAIHLDMDLIQDDSGDVMVEGGRIPARAVTVLATGIQPNEGAPRSVTTAAVSSLMVGLERPTRGGVVEEIVRIPPVAFLAVLLVTPVADIVEIDLLERAHGMQLLSMDMTPLAALLLMALVAVPLVEFRVVPVVEGNPITLVVAGLEDDQLFDGHGIVVTGVVRVGGP
jgi:hypothetical protein